MCHPSFSDSLKLHKLPNQEAQRLVLHPLPNLRLPPVVLKISSRYVPQTSLYIYYMH